MLKATDAPAQRRSAVTSWWPVIRSRFWGVPAALVLYAGLRAISLLVLAAYANARHVKMGYLLTRFDANWYIKVVQDGYDHAIPIGAHGKLLPTDLAFFPLYPGLIAAGARVLPMWQAEVAIAWLAGLAAAWGLYKIGAHLRDPATGILLAGLWAVLPRSIVESMGYSETTFTALAAWSLYAVLRRNWLTAGVLCLFAGLTRPTAIALVAAVCLAALVTAVRDPRLWRAWVALVVAPLGMLGYIAWVGRRLGRTDGYFYLQNKAWNMRFDGGTSAVRWLNRVVTQELPVDYAIAAVVLVVAVALLVIAIGERLPWPLLVYAGLVFGLAVGAAEYFWAKPRMLLPAFPLLLPVAYWLARARRTVPIAVLGALTALSAFEAVYVLLVSRRSP